MQEKIVVYYINSTYAVYNTTGAAHIRRQTTTSFRCVFRVKLKDKTNAKGCS
jgi:hypothetical protein